MTMIRPYFIAEIDGFGLGSRDIAASLSREQRIFAKAKKPEFGFIYAASIDDSVVSFIDACRFVGQFRAGFLSDSYLDFLFKDHEYRRYHHGFSRRGPFSRNKDTVFIYIMKHRGGIKIGLAADVLKRAKSLNQTEYDKGPFRPLHIYRADSYKIIHKIEQDWHSSNRSRATYKREYYPLSMLETAKIHFDSLRDLHPET